MAASVLQTDDGRAGWAARARASPVLALQLQEPAAAEDELAAVLSCSSGEEGSAADDQAGGRSGAGGPAASTLLSLVGEGLAAVPADLAVRHPTLRRLCLHGNVISSVAGLAGLSALRDLNLSSNSIVLLPDGSLSGLHQLTSLSLASNCLAQLGPGALAGLPRLLRLSLAHNSLASLAGLGALRGGPLERLDVRDNALASLAEFSVLAGLPRLGELHVAGGSPGETVGRWAAAWLAGWLGSWSVATWLAGWLAPASTPPDPFRLLTFPTSALHPHVRAALHMLASADIVWPAVTALPTAPPAYHPLQATRCAVSLSSAWPWRPRCRTCACWTGSQ